MLLHLLKAQSALVAAMRLVLILENDFCINLNLAQSKVFFFVNNIIFVKFHLTLKLESV